MFNRTELEIGIDTIVFTLSEDMATIDYLDKLQDIFTNKEVALEYTLSNHQIIICNQYGSSIATIDNYYNKDDKKITKANLYGINQIFTDGKEFQEEHLLIIQWIMRYSQDVSINTIAISFDQYMGYYKTIVRYKNTDLINQHDYEIKSLTKFGTREILIPTKYIKMIDEIDSKTNLKDTVSYTDSYKLKVELEVGNQYCSYKQVIEVPKEEQKYKTILDILHSQMRIATHIKYNIKDAATYYTIKGIVEKNNIEIIYSKKAFSTIDVVIFDRTASNTNIIRYGKYERDSSNEYKEPFIIPKYQVVAEKYKTKLSQVKQDRTEITLKELRLDVRDSTTYTTLMSKIKEQTDKLEITIFKSAKERIKYQTAIEQYHKLLLENQKYNELVKENKQGTKRRTTKVKITDYGARILRINDKQIIDLIEDLELLIIMGVKPLK